MPAIIDLDLDHDPVVARPARLHGAACALLEASGTDHTGQHKPFSVAPLVARDGHTGWTLGWLADRPPPPIPGAIRFGTDQLTVRGHRVDHQPFARLAAGPPASYAELDIRSPLYFSRNGRDHPLPDPVLILRSALTRWNHHAPAALTIDEPAQRDLLSTARLTGMDGRTVRATVSATLHQLGFVGAVAIALTRQAGPTTHAVFAALMRFAAIAGLGAQTTHGFGATHLTALNPPREP